MARKAIPVNVARQLWAGCGGYCQNPSCNRFLFATVGDDSVSLANVAHIIGHGENGPRSDHKLAELIDRDGLDNLIMLCLECHKVVDELEKKFSVEAIRIWKSDHERKVREFFNIPRVTDERELLIKVSELLDENGAIFREYGPYSQRVLEGDSGDALIIWRRRCLDTILPNNRRIVNLIEKNKRNFPYPWDVYRPMLNYKLHVDAFEDNCLLGQKVNDYKLFPVDFDHFVKTKLGAEMPPLERRGEEELEFRHNQVSTFINRFLANHDFIAQMEELNRATMSITLKDGRELRVFVTNTYYFTEYTLEKVMAVDPQVEVIICSCPAGQYAEDAKQLCIEHGIGLFMFGEFMGALRKTGEHFLNYLLRSEREDRINSFKRPLECTNLPKGLQVYLFGSYLRRKLYEDIDAVIVYSNFQAKDAVERVSGTLKSGLGEQAQKIDLTICSTAEFSALKLTNDNLTKVYAS
ncbi:nucleotidyltransferase [Halomonas halodenitrificans]|uniref:nucleotidyltransferase n=1 Tax=Halomonas halodenitrificans TaxID=28252 RepID=UPI000A050914|nr:nucleotidyltransferase [Halomonas halodenitrificans]